MDSNTIIIAFGANVPSALGTPSDAVGEAFKRLCAASYRPIAMSRLYRSPAYPAESGPDFINACGCFEVSDGPADVLSSLHEIEAELGRQRHARWGARVIDLDLIAFGNMVLPNEVTLRHWRGLSFEEQQVETPKELILPHPRLEDRGFVLIPLAEVAPAWRHPLTAKTVCQMVTDLPYSQIEGLTPFDPARFCE